MYFVIHYIVLQILYPAPFVRHDDSQLLELVVQVILKLIRRILYE